MIETLTSENEDEVLSLIGQDALSNITLIADVTQLRDWCDVRILRENGDIKAVFSLYHDLDFLAGAFWSQDSSGLETIMHDMDVFGKKVVFICTGPQLHLLSKFTRNHTARKERQMCVTQDMKLKSWGDQSPKKLAEQDAKGLRELYAICGIPAWTPTAMGLGPFYGLQDDSGQIICVAGVHYVTPFGAEVGNVATHPDYRRRGLASDCVRAVAEELMLEIPCVALHFFEDNTGAQKLYERMGFEYTHVDPLYFVEAQF